MEASQLADKLHQLSKELFMASRVYGEHHEQDWRENWMSLNIVSARVEGALYELSKELRNGS